LGRIEKISEALCEHSIKSTILKPISGNKVSPQIHFANLPSQFVNLPKYLFLGYSKKSSLGSMTVQVEITNLKFELN
jgi:hypothetical protein